MLLLLLWSTVLSGPLNLDEVMLVADHHRMPGLVMHAFTAKKVRHPFEMTLKTWLKVKYRNTGRSRCRTAAWYNC